MGHLSKLKSIGGRQKVLHDDVLNRAGIQVARIVGARAVDRVRPLAVPGWCASFAERLESDGLVTIEDFLPSDRFDGVVTGARQRLDDPTQDRIVTKLGPNRMDSVALDYAGGQRYSGIDGLIDDPRLWDLMTVAGRLRVGPEATAISVERLSHGELDGSSDPENELHCDSYHTTVKAWLYLTDVTTDDGTLRYVPGSHRLSALSLREAYRHSNRHGVSPSRRIDADEITGRVLRPPVELACRRNTLVVADTFGYHRRGPGRPGGLREAIHLHVIASPAQMARKFVVGLRDRR